MCDETWCNPVLLCSYSKLIGVTTEEEVSMIFTFTYGKKKILGWVLLSLVLSNKYVSSSLQKNYLYKRNKMYILWL